MYIKHALSVAVGTVMVLLTATAALGQGEATGSPWTPYRAVDVEFPAGTRCGFAIRSEVVADKERIRTLTTDSEGAPREQKIVGQLKLRLTNLGTGRTVTRNFTGNGLVEYPSAGGFVLTLQGGHMLVGLRPGDARGPGLYGLGGAGHTVTIASDGARALEFGDGPVEDLCATLAAAH